MNNKLAIVIPAYKSQYFHQTLLSIANQTCKNFTLYIGDDASPENLGEIITLFKDKLNIVYKRFEVNFGARNLVSHWNRCVDLVKDEEWIWFFSDDDLMDKKCVELFYKYTSEHPERTLLHFNIQIIDSHNTPLYKKVNFPAYLSSVDFFNKRLNCKLHSCAVEYIFKRDLFEKVNRFEVFDLGWASDDATWIKLSTPNGIHTIEHADVYWRQSTVNISHQTDSVTVQRKLEATINYVNWATDFFMNSKVNDKSTKFEKASYPIRVIAHTRALTNLEKINMIGYTVQKMHLRNVKIKVTLFWVYIEAKKIIKQFLSASMILRLKINS